jgi:hypothetical protein
MQCPKRLAMTVAREMKMIDAVETGRDTVSLGIASEESQRRIRTFRDPVESKRYVSNLPYACRRAE